MKDGGPAFSRTYVIDRYGECLDRGSSGMSLRDYFAGQALVLLANDGTSGFEWEQRTAANAYALADAMLKERGRDV